VVQTYHALIDRSRVCSQMENLTPDEDVLAYLPMAWIGQNIFSYAQALVTGYTVNCPESPMTVTNDMREIGPTYYFARAGVETLLTQVMIRMDDASRIKRAMFRYFMDVARRVGGRILDGARVALPDRIRYALGKTFVYGPLRNMLGMSASRSRIRPAKRSGRICSRSTARSAST